MPDIKKMMEKLKEFGIQNEEELDRALEELQPLDISCMVVKPSEVVQKETDKKSEENM